MMRNSVVVLGLVLALAGCGGRDSGSDSIPLTVLDETTPASSEPAATSETEVADTTTTAATDEVPVAAGAADSCELVTADDVEAATGLTIVSVDGAAALPPNGCVFGFGLSADLWVETGDRAEFLFTNYMDLVDDGTAELIADLGATAVYAGSFRGLAVDAGEGRFLSVILNGGYPEELAESRDAMIALASAALARL